MNPEPREPFGAEIDALVAADRSVVPPADALARVRWRLVGGAPPASNPGATPAPPGWLASHAAGVAVAAFVVGGLGGFGIRAALQGPAPARVVLVASPTTSVPAPRAAPDSIPLAAPLASTAPTAPTAPQAEGVRATAEESLTGERAILDRARSALIAGDAAKSLLALEEHARRFRRPQLAEEREALAIQSLAVLGRFDEARARAARLRATSPNSLFMPAVDATLASIPR